MQRSGRDNDDIEEITLSPLYNGVGGRVSNTISGQIGMVTIKRDPRYSSIHSTNDYRNIEGREAEDFESVNENGYDQAYSKANPLNNQSADNISSNTNAHNKNISDSESDGGHHHGEVGKSSVLGASFNFANSIIGAGIIGIPYAIMQCGFYTGIILLCTVAVVVYYSVVMMIDCGIRANKLDLEELCLHLLGERGFFLAMTVMSIFAYGAQIAYMVIIGDTIPAVAENLFSSDNIFANRTFSMIILATFVMLPICLQRDLSSMSWTSMLSVVSDLALISIVLSTSSMEAQKQGTSMSLHNLTIFNEGVFAGIGAMSFAFVCQHNSFMVFRSLKEPNSENWQKVAFYSISFSLALALCIGITGYLSFGGTVKGDLLNNFPASHVPIGIARSLLAACMICTYPLECYVARHCLLKLIHKWRQSSREHSIASPSALSSNVFFGNFRTQTQFSMIDSSSHSEAEQGKSTLEDDHDGMDDDGSTRDDDLPHRKPSITLHETQNNEILNTSDESIFSGSEVITEQSALESTNHSLQDFKLIRHVLATLALWFTSVTIAISAKNLGVVLSLTGAVAASFLGYMLPAVIFIRTFPREFEAFVDNIRRFEYPTLSFYFVSRFALCLFMLVFGALLLFMGVSTVIVQQKQ